MQSSEQRNSERKATDANHINKKCQKIMNKLADENVLAEKKRKNALWYNKSSTALKACKKFK